MKNLKKSAALIAILGACGLFLASCGGSGGGSSGVTKTSEATKADLLIAISPPTSLITPLPPAPEFQNARASVAGVDVNANGVRDDIEISLAKTALHDGGTASSSDFSKLLEVVKIIQPSETSKTLDHRKFYCAYRSMPNAVKERVSAAMMIALVTDTAARKKAYAEQSTNTSGSLGAESCE
jgi:hypothetical protein